MDNRFEIEQKLGVSLGGAKENRKSVVEAFKGKGLVGLRPTTVSRIKAGTTSGERTDWRLDASKVLEENDASLKNSFYEQIVQTGLEDRLFNTAPQRAHILKSDHYVEAIAEALTQDPKSVRLCIRAMRADMVLSQIASPDSKLLGSFLNIAEGYINANLRISPSERSPAIVALNISWDHATVESFYRNIYAAAATSKGGRVIGTWTPYEIEALSLFYKQQNATGNRLTPFDRSVLVSYIKSLPASQIASETKSSVGIDMDIGVIERHRNALVYGRPAYHSVSVQ